MSCNKLTYQGKEYTEEELLTYISNNPDDFSDIQPSVIPSRAGKVTLEQAEEFLKRNNADIREIQRYSGLQGRAVISPLGSFVEYVGGNKDITLPEEAMHIAVAMLKTSSPKLYSDMMGKISQYNIYRAIMQDETDDSYKKRYLTKEGKPDIRKIKEEAVAKLLVEMVINKNEGINEHPQNLQYTQNWWQKVVDFFKNLFGKGYNPFREGAEKAFNQTAALNENGEFYQLSEEQKQKQQVLSKQMDEQLTTHGVTKIEQDATVEGEDDVNKYVRTVDGKQVEVQRVTDIVDQKKDSSFKARIANASPGEKKVYKLQAEWGTRFHKDAQNITVAATDNEGYLKPIEEINLNGIVPNMYPEFFDSLSTFLLGTKELPGYLYTQFPSGTLFKVEQQVFDPKRNNKKGLAGTIDLLGITPDGKVIIKDWKTMFLDLKTKDDVPYYKTRDTAIQLGEYKKILRSAYGVPYDNISAQGQPIVYEGKMDKKNGTLTPTAITLPGDIKTENRKFVLPITTKDEKTGNAALDDLIDGFYKLHEHLSRRSTDDKALKDEQLNDIADTIRNLQIRQNFTPVVNEAKLFLKSADRLIADVTQQVKDKSFTTKEDKSALKEKVRSLLDDAVTILNNIDKYASLYSIFDDIYGKDTLTEEQKATQQSLKDLAADTGKKKDGVFAAFKVLMEYEGKLYGIDDLLEIQKNVEGYLNRDTQSTTRLQVHEISLFYKLESAAKTNRDIAIQEGISKLEPILKASQDYAKSRGVSADNYLSLIQAKDKEGKSVNELIEKIKTEAWTKLKEAATSGDTDFIKDNIDVDKYKAALAQKKAYRIALIDAGSYTNEEALEKKAYLDREYDLSKDNSLGWYRYKDMTPFLKEDKWYTDEYLAIKDIPALADMYKWIEDLNVEAHNSGYHQYNSKYSRRFLPYLNKRSSILSMDFFANLFKIREDEEAYYGKVDPETGQLEKSIPRPFLRELPELSTDMGLNLTSYLKSVMNYKYLSNIEQEVKAIEILSRAKGHYEIDKNGKIVMESPDKPMVIPGNEQNFRLLSQQIDALLYSIHYSQDSGLGSPEATKAVESANNYMALKIFGGNIISPFINTTGGNLQGLINSGKLWGHQQWETNFMKSMVFHELENKKKDITLALMDYFMLLTEDPNKREMKQLSSQQLNKFSVQEFLMGGMRRSDMVVQHATARSMLDNTALIDGQLVNVREYIREQDREVKYEPGQEALRKKLEKTYKKRVEDFITNDPRILHKIATFNKEGILEIPGFSRSEEEFNLYRRKVQAQIKMITGGMTEDEIRNMDRNVMLKSMSMFKGWIPRMMEARTGAIKYNAATDEYEMGRTRIWLSILLKGTDKKYRKGTILRTIFSTGLLQGIGDLIDMQSANKRGLQLLQEYYEKVADRYKEQTGNELKMDAKAFYDLTRQAITMQWKDISLLLLLLGAYWGYSAIPPPEDPDDKNWHNSISRVLSKLHDELSFYYNPLSFQQIANGSVLPALGILIDGQKITKNLYTEVFGDEDAQSKTHAIKSVLHTIPILNQATSTILPLMSPETARELGYRVNPQNNFNH